MKQLFLITLTCLTVCAPISAQKSNYPDTQNSALTVKTSQADKETSTLPNRTKLPIPITAEQIKTAHNKNYALTTKLNNLPKKKKEKLKKLADKSSIYLSQKRTSEAMRACYDAQQILENVPSVLNSLAACYITYKDYESAKKLYKEALTYSPLNPGLNFNIGEMDFITHNFEQSLKQFQQTKTLSQGSLGNLEGLLDFKIALCHLALSKNKDTDHQTIKDHKKAFENYFTSSQKNQYSPEYFILQATKKYDAGNITEANKLVNHANKVFQGTGKLIPWLDTIEEYGYLNIENINKTDTNNPSDLNINLNK